MIRFIATERSQMPRAALFLDRDGVLNRRVVGGYVTEPRDFEFLDVVLESIAVARQAGAAVVVVTNQGCIGRNLASREQVDAIHALLCDDLDQRGLTVDAIYTCPHHPRALDPAQRMCECRKPKPGLILAAAHDLNLDVAASALIGDQPSDIAAATAAGIPGDRAVLVGADLPDPTARVQRLFAADGSAQVT